MFLFRETIFDRFFFDFWDQNGAKLAPKSKPKSMLSSKSVFLKKPCFSTGKTTFSLQNLVFPKEKHRFSFEEWEKDLNIRNYFLFYINPQWILTKRNQFRMFPNSKFETAIFICVCLYKTVFSIECLFFSQKSLDLGFQTVGCEQTGNNARMACPKSGQTTQEKKR